MKNLISCILLLFLISTAKAQSAIDFNDAIAGITDSLYKQGTAWGHALNEGVKSGNYTGIRPVRENLSGYLDASIARVKKMNNVEGSETLKQAALDFLVFEKSMVTEAFTVFEKFSVSTSKEDINTAVDNLTRMSETEAVHLQKLKIAQSEFAKKNGFYIEGDETEDE